MHFPFGLERRFDKISHSVLTLKRHPSIIAGSKAFGEFVE